MNIQEYLGRHNVPFEVLDHEATYDAQHLAHAVHRSGHHVAKTVLLHSEGQFVIAVVPATHAVDFGKASSALANKVVRLASELELAGRCPDCEIGTLPPFGSHYEMQTFVDESLASDQDIVFEGSTHREAIRMKYADFADLEHPHVVSLT